jgi:Zn-dependent protease
MKFSPIEISHLLRAWILISIAFAVVIAGFSFSAQFLVAIAFAAITAGIGFLGHELMHKYVAQRYGCWAEFRANNAMLGIMFLLSFFGLIFAAPGGVYIMNHVTTRKNGIIALAGPLTNIVLGAAFAALTFALPAQLQPLGNYGMTINFFLGFFNLLPLPGIDGSKVLAWNKAVYGTVFAASIALSFGAGQLVALMH